MRFDEEFDYVVVGAGSAGCALANRLSADGTTRVLLLEAGGDDRRFWVQLPIGYGKTYYQSAVNWMYTTEPVPGLAGQPSYWPRGKVLGGSSSINAMVWIRGNAADYDAWQAAGNPGWSYQDVLPYFKRSETFVPDATAAHATDMGGAMADDQRPNGLTRGASMPGDTSPVDGGDGDKWRGRSGPVHVADVTAQLHPLCRDFIQAGCQAGLPFNPDFNGARQDGVGYYQISVKNGWRMSASRAYLWPARRRSNLRIQTRALVDRVLFEGRRAVGVAYTQGGHTRRVRARAEVVLCAGAIGSPALLQHSGIGPRALLEALGIPIVCDRPAIGQHLQDHVGVDYLFRSRKPSLNNVLSPWWGRARAALQFAFWRRGPLGLSVNQAGGFMHSRPGLAQPNLQLYFSPLSYTRAPAGTRPLMHPDPFPAFLLGVSNCRPQSRGQIRIRSRDPREAPMIQPAYLSEPADVQELLEGVKHIRRLAAMPALAAVIEQEMRPGSGCVTDEALIQDIHANAWSVFHPASTCRMGPDPQVDAVDAHLRVHGVVGLRVADASIFPHLVSGNTNAPVIMVGERAADLILQDATKV